MEYEKTNRQLIKYKSPSILELEEKYKDMGLSFNIKTSYFKPRDNERERAKRQWSKTYYEVSYFENDEKHILKFYIKRGYRTLGFYFEKALHTGGDEQND